MALAHWDLNTYMPKDGSSSRAQALGKVAKLHQKLFLDKEFVALISKAQKQNNLNDFEKAVLRILNRAIKHYRKLPPEFIEEYTKVTSSAQIAWRQAKEKNNFNIFKPHLEKIIQLVRKKAQYLGYKDHPYDALLDEYEEDLTTKQVQKYFDEIKNPLFKIIKYIRSSKNYNTYHPLEKQRYDTQKMQELNKKIVDLVHYNLNHLRIDTSPHPFSINIGPGDQRITTRYQGFDFARSYGATIHEYGHALYELQSAKQLDYTPIQGGSSLVIHESQSRFWENMIGKSKDFVELLYQDIVQISPNLKKYSAQQIYNYLHVVRPSLIRTEADEVTYHLHIIIRFEIEKELLEGKIKVKDLPYVWNKKYRDYLGIIPEKDSEGVLQDIHWSQGSIGYFPTYSLGTALSAMWKNQIEKDLGEMSSLVKSKQGIRKIQDWLKENIHQYGSTYTFRDLVKKVTKKDFDSKYLIDYLNQKYNKIY